MLRIAASASLVPRQGATSASMRHLGSISFAGKGQTPLSISAWRSAPLTRFCGAQERRALFSSSSSSGSGSGAGAGGGKGGNKKPFEPPRIELNPSSGNPLHAQAAKAQALHAELQELLDKQAARRAEEAAQPFYHGFVQFMKRSRSEMINIGAAFACVLLAYQIVALRKGARRLVDRTEERERTLGELRAMLGGVQSEEFVTDLARKCSQTIEDSGAAASPSGRSNGGGGGLFGWGSSSGASSSSNSDTDPAAGEDDDEIAAIIRTVLMAELRAVIGNAYLSDEQKEEQRFKELTMMMGVEKGVAKAKASFGGAPMEKALESKDAEKEESALRGLEEVLAEVAKEDPSMTSGGGGDGSAGGAATKKRIRYAI